MSVSYIEALRPFVHVAAEAEDNDYQGDYYVLFTEGSYAWSPDSYGFIASGYGSCSGCDAWEDATTGVARAKLILELLEGAKRFDGLDEAKAYVAATEDRKLEWYGHTGAWSTFQAAVAALTE